ncbi:GPP34 family phosphoprotein [bacterium]|nr:GPP34 family phosphoprotein [bacterium]RQV95261.1 MAG: GPP34 family phosphoprotein [bacterium]
MVPYAIAGAILSELLFSKRIMIDESKKKKPVHCIDSTPMGEPLIDRCLEMISLTKKPKSLQTWISRFANIKKLNHRVAEALCSKGILRADEDKILMIFTRKIYPEVNPEPEKKLIERLQGAIFAEVGDIDPRTVVLISLAKSSDLLKVIFDKKKLKEQKKRIKQIANGEIIGKATQEAIAAMHSAVMVACIMPAITATAVNR